jgi:hypothetical protein
LSRSLELSLPLQGRPAGGRHSPSHGVGSIIWLKKIQTWIAAIPTWAAAILWVLGATLATLSRRTTSFLGVRPPSWTQLLLFLISLGRSSNYAKSTRGRVVQGRLPFLSAIRGWFSRLNHAIDNVSGAPGFALLLYAVILLFSSDDGDPWSFIILLFGGLLLASAIGRMASTRGRRAAFAELRPIGWLVPFG